MYCIVDCGLKKVKLKSRNVRRKNSKVSRFHKNSLEKEKLMKLVLVLYKTTQHIPKQPSLLHIYIYIYITNNMHISIHQNIIYTYSFRQKKKTERDIYYVGIYIIFLTPFALKFICELFFFCSFINERVY